MQCYLIKRASLFNWLFQIRRLFPILQHRQFMILPGGFDELPVLPPHGAYVLEAVLGLSRSRRTLCPTEQSVRRGQESRRRRLQTLCYLVILIYKSAHTVSGEMAEEKRLRRCNGVGCGYGRLQWRVLPHGNIPVITHH